MNRKNLKENRKEVKRLNRIMNTKPEKLIKMYFWRKMSLVEKIKYYVRRVERGFLFFVRALVPVAAISIVLYMVTPLESGLNDSIKLKDLVTKIHNQLPAIEKAYKDISSFGGALSKQKSNLNEDKAFVYAFLITKYSNDYGLDPHLVAGVMAVESEFNSKAVSSANAKGLMQIHQPSWHLPDKTLFDEEQNIKHGAKILFMYRNSNPSEFLKYYGGFSDKTSKEAANYESKVKGKRDSIRFTHAVERSKYGNGIKVEPAKYSRVVEKSKSKNKDVD